MSRPAPSCATEDNTRADGMSGHDIYTLLTTGKGTGSIHRASSGASDIRDTYDDIHARLQRIDAELGEAWQGASAEAAIATGVPIKDAMGKMSTALNLASVSLTNQGTMFEHAKTSLKPMPASKPETGLWDNITPWDTDTEDAANAFNSDEAHNRQVYAAYQNASRANTGQLPTEFGDPDGKSDTAVIDTTSDKSKAGTTSTTAYRPPGSTGQPTTSGQPQTNQPPAYTPPPQLPGDTTNTSWLDQDPSRKPEPPVRTPSGDRPPGAIGVPPGMVPGPVRTAPPGSTPPRKSVPPGGGGGSGSGAGKFGPANPSGNNTPGGRAGVLGTATPSGQALAGTTAGGRGTAGGPMAGGMAGGAAGRGQGADDGEHKSAEYLVNEENTNAIIGDMPMTAPQTIGE